MNGSIDQLAMQFATALARDEADAQLVAQRAYELADAFRTEQHRRRDAQDERAWERAIAARSVSTFEAAGDDPRGLAAAPMTWIDTAIDEEPADQMGAWVGLSTPVPDPTVGEPAWRQQYLFEAPGLLDEVPPPPSERLFGQPANIDEDELPVGFDEPWYDPRWEAKPEVTAEDSSELTPRFGRPGLAVTRPGAAPAKTGSDDNRT